MGRELERREKNAIVGESAQYTLALVVVGVMLYVVGMPAFVIFFLGAFSFFLWKLFANNTASDARKIFEFYLAANEILRDDDRRWYGFELQDAISRGEKILHSMPSAPPLLHFAIGALYLKIGDHELAEKNLAPVVSEGTISEAAIVFPSNDLREYVRILRKIEREPAQAPQTSAAVRSLERIRKNRGKMMLERSRQQLVSVGHRTRAELEQNGHGEFVSFRDEPSEHEQNLRSNETAGEEFISQNRGKFRNTTGDPSTDLIPLEKGGFHGRKPISEVLQDIYDDKIQ